MRRAYNLKVRKLEIRNYSDEWQMVILITNKRGKEEAQVNGCKDRFISIVWTSLQIRLDSVQQTNGSLKKQ